MPAELAAWLDALTPLAEAMLRVFVGLALVPHALRNTFDFFPKYGLDTVIWPSAISDTIIVSHSDALISTGPSPQWKAWKASTSCIGNLTKPDFAIRRGAFCAGARCIENTGANDDC